MRTVDKQIEPKSWSLLMTAKLVSIPMLLLAVTSIYMLKVPKAWFDHSTAVSEFVTEDVSIVADLVDALTQHHAILARNAIDSNSSDASALRQQQELARQVLENSQKFNAIGAIDNDSVELRDIREQLQSYLSDNVDSQNTAKTNSTTSSFQLVSDQYLSLQSELLKFLQEPESFVEMVSDNTKYDLFLPVSIALLMLIAISFIVFTALNAMALCRYFGGTPEQLNYIANCLLADNPSQSMKKFGHECSGVIGVLHEIGVKVEEERAGKMLNMQIDNDYSGNAISGDTDTSIVEQTSEHSASRLSAQAEVSEADSLLDVDQPTESMADDKLSVTGLNDEKAQTSDRLELEKMRSSKALDDSRISAILKTAKALAAGDLSSTSNVIGDDDIGLIAHWQKENLNNLKSLLTSSISHTKSITKSSLLLRDVNGQMSQSSDRTAEQAVLVSNSAGEISQNVDSVALAVKEMSTSIREISEHTAEAAQVAEHAVVLASDTGATVRKLSDSSTAIGAVIKVINSIAEQTNLLALNATIEAARAGDAGKGFAVVANEVKELAKETARATEEIAQQIATIQADSNDAVSIIGDISKIIDRINEIQSTIAAAVEEQAVTTSDINRSISDVSQGSSVIAQNVSSVADTAKENQDSVECAKNTVDQLILASKDLDELVSKYKLTENATLPKAA